MNILIASANLDLFTELLGKSPKITQQTANTCTFRVTQKTFVKLRDKIRERGINPFAAMYWY